MTRYVALAYTDPVEDEEQPEPWAGVHVIAFGDRDDVYRHVAQVSREHPDWSFMSAPITDEILAATNGEKPVRMLTAQDRAAARADRQAAIDKPPLTDREWDQALIEMQCGAEVIDSRELIAAIWLGLEQERDYWDPTDKMTHNALTRQFERLTGTIITLERARMLLPAPEPR